jgi:cytochrome c peroxidase
MKWSVRLSYMCYMGMVSILVSISLNACYQAPSNDPSSNTPINPTLPPTPMSVQLNREALGQRIFTDTNLSEPRGLACQSCHQANQGFSGLNGSTIGVPQGSRLGVLGLRNTMTNAYNGLVPTFAFRTEDDKTEAFGGHFWDGRADTLEVQALGPFLNPDEMNNPDAASVVAKVARSSYANLFRQEFGADIFSQPTVAFEKIGVAIAAFERSDALQSYTSKYDAVVRGKTTFNPNEQRGMALFMDANRANCSGCHLMNPTTKNPKDSPFSEFSYYALGIPRNRAIPKNADSSFYDLGLCGPNRSKPTLPNDVPSGVNIEQFCGQFRMPTLRNVAERPAFMHNGFFKDLTEVVTFYSTRNSNPERWYGPTGIANDLPSTYLNNIEHTKSPLNRAKTSGPLLNAGEIRDIVAFLHTLSDGYKAPL